MAYTKSKRQTSITKETCRLLYSYSLRFNISIVLPIQTILFCYVLMYRRFADSKLFCRLPDSCVAVYDVVGDGDGPLLDVLLHELLPENVFYIIFPIHSSYDSGSLCMGAKL